MHASVREIPVADREAYRSRADVCLRALRSNARWIGRRAPSSRVMAVVKADAYGHGLPACVAALAESAIDAFGVATLDEALAVRAIAPDREVLVLPGLHRSELPDAIEREISIGVGSVDELEALEAVAGDLGRRARVHVNVDVGMRRNGAAPSSVPRILGRAASSRSLALGGIFSHFPRADEPGAPNADEQLERFLRLAAPVTRRAGWRGPGHDLVTDRPALHIANSAAILAMPAAHLDMVRPGLLLYGLAPGPRAPRPEGLSPVMTWTARISHVRRVTAGATVGYGSTWRAPRATWLATITVGYADGYPRALSNRGYVYVADRLCPVVGTVSMDAITVSLGPEPVGRVGDIVTLAGSPELPWGRVAEWAGTIPYELLTRVSARVPRTHVDRGDTPMRGAS